MPARTTSRAVSVAAIGAALVSLALPSIGAEAQTCPSGFSYSRQVHRCVRAPRPARCAEAEHLSAGHCCAAGHDWVAARATCLCIDALTCGPPPEPGPVPVPSATTTTTTTTGDRDASYHAMKAAFSAGDDANAARLADGFVRGLATDRAAAAMLVEARWILASLAARAPRANAASVHQRWLDVVAAYRTSGAPPGSEAAYFAASASFALADEGTAQALLVSVELGRESDVEALIAHLRDRLAVVQTETTEPYVARMAAIEGFQTPLFTVASRVAQGRAYERLVDATRDALRSLDVYAFARQFFRAHVSEELRERGIRGAAFRRALDAATRSIEDEGTMDEIVTEIEIQLETRVDEMTREVACAAAVRYVSAARVARIERLSDESTSFAIQRLDAFGAEPLAACVELERQTNATFAQIGANEFVRSPQRPELLRWAPSLAPATDAANPALRDGLAALHAGDLDLAAQRLEEADQPAARSVLAVYHLGVIEERRLRPERALARYAEALQIQPAFIPAMEATALSRIRSGDAAGALAFLDAQADGDSSRSELEALRSLVLGTLGRWTDAMAAARLALASDAGSIAALTAVARAALALGDEREADSALATLAAREASLPADADFAESHYVRGNLARRRVGQDRAALEEFARAVRSYPDHADARMALGVGLLVAGDYDPAVQHLRVAAAVAPWSWQFRLAYADALRSTRRYDEALREIEGARGRAPNQPEIRYARALLLMERGNCLRGPSSSTLADCSDALDALVAYRRAQGIRARPGDATEGYVTTLTRIVSRLQQAAEAAQGGQ